MCTVCNQMPCVCTRESNKQKASRMVDGLITMADEALDAKDAPAVYICDKCGHTLPRMKDLDDGYILCPEDDCIGHMRFQPCDEAVMANAVRNYFDKSVKGDVSGKAPVMEAKVGRSVVEKGEPINVCNNCLRVQPIDWNGGSCCECNCGDMSEYVKVGKISEINEEALAEVIPTDKEVSPAAKAQGFTLRDEMCIDKAPAGSCIETSDGSLIYKHKDGGTLTRTDPELQGFIKSVIKENAGYYSAVQTLSQNLQTKHEENVTLVDINEKISTRRDEAFEANERLLKENETLKIVAKDNEASFVKLLNENRMLVSDNGKAAEVLAKTEELMGGLTERVDRYIAEDSARTEHIKSVFNKGGVIDSDSDLIIRDLVRANVKIHIVEKPKVKKIKLTAVLGKHMDKAELTPVKSYTDKREHEMAWSTAFPSHHNFGRDCCGFFVPTKDGTLCCNECGGDINMSIGAMYAKNDKALRRIKVLKGGMSKLVKAKAKLKEEVVILSDRLHYATDEVGRKNAHIDLMEEKLENYCTGCSDAE